ncbi:MAG: RibD family protein, partial [Moorea sp. SIO2B7]|nr:RibD family protein [Moorena sp. SIO2B7]
MNRPQTTVILAMTADGKIADVERSPARFASSTDKNHLEKQISLVDGVIFGAGTLRAYGTTLPISNPQLLQARKKQQKPLQPIHIVCSASGEIDPKLRFFSQPVPCWLLTTSRGAKYWQEMTEDKFERILVAEIISKNKETISNPKSKIQPPLYPPKEGIPKSINWIDAFTQLGQLGFKKLAILGGGKLIASLLAADLIDEFWLTVCPVIFGGTIAPTPVEGVGFSPQQAKS